MSILGSNETHLGDATGFFFRKSEAEVYLITNWHVVTGRQAGNPRVCKNGAIPCYLKCGVHRKTGRSEVSISQVGHFLIEINNEGGEDPKWIEHPNYRNKVDVVAIKLNNLEELNAQFKFSPLNDYSEFESRYSEDVMDTVFVIGYPWGLSGGSDALPLFKRGSIATEPIVNYAGLPQILIDCRTSEAMSGSPVLVSHSGIWHPDGRMSSQSLVGTLVNFIGIYSGRMKSKEKKGDAVSEIGVVWKKEVLDEIIDKGVRGFSLPDDL